MTHAAVGAKTTPVLRFAPSPNGFLHLGHAYSALLNAALARRLGGRLLLRIEDIDPTRCRPEFEQAIYEDLAWLGLAWEEPVRRQSDHMDDYGAALAKLREMGLVYPCFASRQEIRTAIAERERTESRPWPRDPDGAPLYPGLARRLQAGEVARRLAAGEPHALRLDMAGALGRPAASGRELTFVAFDPDGGERVVSADPARWGDVVLARKEVPTSYHLSVVVDDALQGVTHVVRGRDLEAATDVHRLLQALLGLPAPRYHHHDLVADEAGLKLAKSRGSPALRDLRAAGIGADEIRQRLGFRL
ncbi:MULTISPECIES: tRNA glutamyl-Q(34) synthetase GluQRS [unclassified Chelatococcus]|uniref:tRNA glutamyl-Q(34) synthetase GluQRS n=1 Tax=unclassified Chelatococcus TaxID=2638111 RepID=UPI000590F6FB|nr:MULTISPECIES: tRNA glutamyl-Q(34) synthetase GluQRS [unclassified Chelatococcus]ALA18027.1 glutamyl-Q tRNA(Asp) ligase [Chelatococcus sp. CO-6]